jgi:hypothetical protein
VEGFGLGVRGSLRITAMSSSFGQKSAPGFRFPPEQSQTIGPICVAPANPEFRVRPARIALPSNAPSDV